MAAEINLATVQGATFRQPINFTTQADALPVPFTGCTAKMQIRPGFGSSTVVQELSTSNGGITIAPGVITLTLNAAATKAIPVKPGTSFPPSTDYVYDLFVTFPGSNGDTVWLTYGKFTVTGSVTQ